MSDSQQVADPRQTVLIAVPNEGWIHKTVVRNVFALLQDNRYKCTYIDPTWKPCEYNRARIHDEAVCKKYDWLLMIDADNPPQRNPLDLIDLNCDVIGLPTLVYAKGGIYWNGMDWNESEQGWNAHKTQEGLQEVDAVGSGCILIARRVLVALHHRQPWVREWDSRGFVTAGTDWAFCKRAKSAGYRVWMHYDYWCEHYKEHAVHEYTMAVERSGAEAPAQSGQRQGR